MSTVSVYKIRSDDYEGIRDAVFRVIEDLGGLNDIIRPGWRVLVTPNFVAVPERRLSGAVTRWEVCLAVCEAVAASGAVPFIAESASVGADTGDVMLFCGYDKLRDAGYELIDLKSGDVPECEIESPSGKIFRKIPSWSPVRDADAIISVPVLKVHDQLGVSLGIKNLKGLVRDEAKKEFHMRGVTDAVCDLFAALRPALCIVDATYCLEGIGPVFGSTRYMGLIAGSKDLVACDAVCGELMDFRPRDVEITAEAAARGLGCASLEEIEIKGVEIDGLREHFDRSSEMSFEGLPEDFRLIIGQESCTGCRNTVTGTLEDMREEGILSGLSGLTAIVGPQHTGDIPDDLDPSKTVCIGACAFRTAGRELGLITDHGCPPLRLKALWKMAKNNIHMTGNDY